MNRRSLLTALIGGAALTACTRSVYVVNNRSFNGSAPLSARTRQITEAVQEANWRVIGSEPGRMRVTFAYTEHRVTLDILYNETEFSLQYVNSAALNYDGSTVHRAYNEWVQALERQIMAQTAVS